MADRKKKITKKTRPTARRLFSRRNLMTDSEKARLDDARFWAKVKCGPKTACWPWLKGPRLEVASHGMLRVRGKTVRAHVYAFAFAHGRHPEPGMQVLHACGNARCCNPWHLMSGDHALNRHHRSEHEAGRTVSVPVKHRPPVGWELRLPRSFAEELLKVNEQVFRRLVDRSNTRVGACWPWIGPVGTAPVKYGRFSLAVPGRPTRLRSAHEVSVYFARGEVRRPWQHLRHTCHNSLCVRPSHLIWGSPADNTGDALTAKRHPRGHRHGMSKLTGQAVIEARRAVRRGDASCARLARKHGVDETTMSKAVRGRSWRHVNAVEAPVSPIVIRHYRVRGVR